MAASESLRFDITANDRGSDAFSRFGRSVADVSAKMDGATARSVFLDDALKRQAETARRGTDAALALARSDDILAEVEKRLAAGALEAEFALKRQGDGYEALGDKAKRSFEKITAAADRMKAEFPELKVKIDTEAAKAKLRVFEAETRVSMDRISRELSIGGRGLPGAGGAGGGGGFLSALPAASGLVNPYTIAGAAALSPFIAQAVAGASVFALGGGLAGLGIAGAFGTGQAPTALQLTAAADRLTAATDNLKKLQASGKTTPGQLAGAQGAVASAQDTFNKLQDSAVDPAQMKMRQSFHNLTQDVQASLVQIGKPFIPVMDSILKTATSVLDKMTPVFAGAEKVIAGPFKVFSDTLLNAFTRPDVQRSIGVVAASFGKLLGALTPAIGYGAGQLADGISRIARSVADHPQAFADLVQGIFKISGVLLDAVSALANFGGYLQQHFWPAMHRTSEIWDGVRHEFAHITDDMTSALIRTWRATWNDTIGVLIRFGHDVERDWDDFRHRTAVVFDGIRGDIAHYWDMAWNNTIGRAQRGIADVVSFVGRLPGRIEGIFTDAGKWLWSAGRNIVGGFLSGITSWGSAIADALLSMIPSWARGFLGLGGGGGTGGVPAGSGVGAGVGRHLGMSSAMPAMNFAAPGSGHAAVAAAVTVHNHITVNVPPTAHPRAVAQEIGNLLLIYTGTGGRLYPQGVTPR